MGENGPARMWIAARNEDFPRPPSSYIRRPSAAMTAAVCILAASAQKKNIHGRADQGAQREGGAAHHGSGWPRQNRWPPVRLGLFEVTHVLAQFCFQVC